MRIFFPGCALIALAVASPALADVKAGVDAWRAGDFPKAVAEWRGPAAAGDPDAQFNLGQAYKLGRGVQADQAAAMDWYRKAAASGHEEAQATLGLTLFQSGKRDEAMMWLKKASDQGEPRAQYVVGTAYFNGDSVTKDWARAYALMTRAKAAGIGAATNSLAQMDQLIPDPQRQAGLALAREMERTAMLKANDAPEGGAPLTMRGPATTPPVGQTSRRPSPPAAPAPAIAAQTSKQPSKAPDGAASAKVAEATTKPAPAVPKTVASAAKPVATVAVSAKVAEATTKPAPAVPKTVAPAVKPVATVAASAGGSWQVQLGAFSTTDAARNAWSKMTAKTSVLKALSPSYVAAGNVTRLRAGPIGSRATANQACNTIKAAGVDCFPVAP